MAQKKSVLITGANGLLGSHLTQTLANEYNVHAYIHNEPDQRIEGVRYQKLSFSEEWNSDALPEQIDFIFHLAQSSKFRDFPDSAINIFDVNIRSTALLLDYARQKKVKRFVYASSGGIYGAGGTFDENATIDAKHDLGYYLGSKLCGELLCRNYTPFMNVSILRFFFLYGKGQKRDMLLPRLVDNVRHGKPINLQGDAGISINPIHVKDAVTYLKRMLSINESQTINVAGKDTYSLRAICDIIGKKVGKEPRYEYIDQSAKSLIADTSLLNEYFGPPTISLEEGLSDLL